MAVVGGAGGRHGLSLARRRACRGAAWGAPPRCVVATWEHGRRSHAGPARIGRRRRREEERWPCRVLAASWLPLSLPSCLRCRSWPLPAMRKPRQRRPSRTPARLAPPPPLPPAVAWAAPVAIPDSSGAGQEQLKCYTRRTNSRPGVRPSVAAAPRPEPEFCAANCEQKNEIREPKPSSKSPKLTGQRSSRKRRTPPSPLITVPGTLVTVDDGNNATAPEPGPNGNLPGFDAAVGRPQRQRKRRIYQDYVRSDSRYYDWRTSYPDEPCPDYGDEADGQMELGEVETISGCDEGWSDSSEEARPMSLKSQTDTQQTRKARRILVEESRLQGFGLRSGPARAQEEHDESAMRPQTPQKVQESNGECEDERNPCPRLSESAPGDDSCCTPSEHASEHLPDSTTEGTTVRLVVDISAGTSNLKEGFSVEAKVKLRKKHIRPKVKRPQKLKIAKPLKIPKTSKSLSRKNSAARGVFDHRNPRSRAKGVAMEGHSRHATATAEFMPQAASGRNNQACKRRWQNEVALSSKPTELALVVTTVVPQNSAEAMNSPFAGEVCSDLPLLGASSGTGNQQGYGDGRDESSVPITENSLSLEQRAEWNPRLEAPGVREATMGKSRCSSILKGVYLVPGGTSVEEEPPSTPRGNVSMVPLPTNPSPSLPVFSQPSFGGGDSSTDSDGEPSGPTRRKRSSLAQRTRRSLLRAVEATETFLVPMSVSAPGVQSNVPVCRMTEAQPHPLSINSSEPSAPEQLQVVVFDRRPREMVVFQEVRTKVKYKPKVVLDPMTVKTFDRLMLQGGEVKDADYGDEDWIEARKLWSDRAHYFNCIMRQVQGDRTFSKWGGSLLDSVVGAFLTQNVSDFLSSNAFMELRAHFPVHEASRNESGDSSEAQCSVTASGCPVWTSSAADLSTPQTAEEDQSDHLVGGSMENLVNAGIANQHESVASMPDAEIQDAQVVSELSIPHTLMDTTSFVEISMCPKSIFAEVPLSDEVQRDSNQSDQSDPYSFSDEERGISSDLVVALEVVHIGSTPAAQGIYSPMKMTLSPSLGVSEEPFTESVDNETFPATECVVKVIPEVATRRGNTVQHAGDSLKEHHSATQADVKVGGEKGNCSGMAGRVAQTGNAPSGTLSILENFERFLNDDTSIPDAREKMLAASLRAILGKPTTEREVAKDQAGPLDIVKWKIPRNKRSVDLNRFRTNIKLLTGADRGNYELKVSYKLDSEQRITWEALRAEVLSTEAYAKDPFTADSVDWEAVRRADVAEVASVIKERGMHYVLGGRIKSLLERLHHDQDGRLDLEWIRKLSPLNAQNFLTSVRGLGLKSVECIRLLTLHHPSFPVDTNVGRIVVRLGWVPLEPLPEETQLHLLELYPIQEQIQKYIWPRLCTLDQQTLYEFHYQLITFGKVFCTKSKPNCNACPMRSQCKHYESAFCSVRPLLQGPGEASSTSMEEIEPLMLRLSMQPPLERRQGILMFGDHARASSQGACVPIIEEPNSPEYVHDIEDTPFTEHCSNVETGYMELLDLDLDLEPLSCRSDSVSMFQRITYMDSNETPTQESEESRIETTGEDAVQESGRSIEDVVEGIFLQSALEEVAHLPSQQLVLLPPEAASSPAPPLKNIQRLRTIHYVYELPDHHPLLVKMDKRDPEDPCFYLLAIWNSDEVPEAMPKISDDDASNPFACSQPGEEAVRGTLLVPCRTAMKGSFPLNGTYFQVNEVFADHASSIVPIDVPRTLLWDLRRRFAYFGTSVTSLFKDMSQEEIQCCFKKGYVCVRAFDQSTRRPRLLATRLHQSGAKIVAGRAAAKRGRRRSTFNEA